MSGKRIIRRLITCAIVAALMPLEAAWASSFTVDDWFLETALREESTERMVGEWSYEPVNPFNEVFSGAVGTSSASTAYDISWNDTSASFRMDADLLITGVGTWPLGRSSSSNSIWITPQEDMLLTVYSEYTYNLPAVGMHTAHQIIVANYDVGGPGTIYRELRGFNSAMGGGSDTFVIDSGVVLPAGTTWQIWSLSEISLNSGSTGRQATGSGFFDIQLTPLPEPTTAMLLLVAAIPAIARRRRNPRSRSM